jgi:hypothetical protein
MKSERRHDLETNWLAKRLGTWGECARPYSTAMTIAVVAILVVVLITLFVSSRAAANRSAAWDAFTYAMTSASTNWDNLRTAAEENPDTKMSQMANITWADAELRRAAEFFFREQAAAESHLDNARDVYRRLIDEAEDPAIVNRARLGMARALEINGDVKEARKFYAAVEGPFKEFAQERSKELALADVQESVTWLASAEMPTVQAPVGPGTPGLRPPFGSGFNLDPQVPTGTATNSTGLPVGAAEQGTPNPLAPDGIDAGGTQELDFENPFDRPSDPDRYGTPSDNASGQPATPPAADPSDGQETTAPQTEVEPTESVDQTQPPAKDDAAADE